MSYTHFLYIAEVYNEGAYGAGLYGEGATAPGLPDTGYDVLLPLFLAIALIAASAILIAKKWLRSRRRQRQEKNWAAEN